MEAGHLGIRNTLNSAIAEFFWPNVCGDITSFVGPATFANGRFKRACNKSTIRKIHTN